QLPGPESYERHSDADLDARRQLARTPYQQVGESGRESHLELNLKPARLRQQAPSKPLVAQGDSAREQREVGEESKPTVRFRPFENEQKSRARGGHDKPGPELRSA